MASSTSSLAASPYPIGPKTQAYLGKMAEEISARGDGLVTDLDVWEAWKATKIPKVTLRYWLEARVFPREKTPDPSSAPLALRPSLSPSALRPCTKPSTQPDLSGLAHTPATYGRGASMRAILESINEDNECGNAGTTPTLARYLNGDEGGISAPIVSQNYYNEGVQSSRGGGVRVSDGVLELAIEIEALGVAGQADLMRRLYKGTAKMFVRKKGEKQLTPFKPDPSLGLVAQLDAWKKQLQAMQALNATRLAARKRKDRPEDGGYAGTALGNCEYGKLADTLGGYWKLN